MRALLMRLAAGGLVLLAGCVEPYEPRVADSDANLLVVDGYINPVGITTIHLSRTAALTGKAVPAEKRARVFIEEDGGRRHPLTETSTAGTYTSAALQLPAGRRVRLRLTTAANREYASDFTPVQLTPAIDSVSWRAGRDRLHVYVNTHDDDRAARHFRWSYDETWEFTSRYESRAMYSRGQIVPRTEDIYHCWGSEAPSTIKLGNTLRLSRNQMTEQVITMVMNTSVKLAKKYSVMVRQYALTPEEYAYWEQLRKNTESLGTPFDPLPTELSGNVHSLTNPAEQVLGYVGAHSMTEQRLFISRPELPAEWPLVTGYESCILKGAGNIPLAALIAFFDDGRNTPVEFNPATEACTFSTTECIDCRLRGSNVKPSFWP